MRRRAATGRECVMHRERGRPRWERFSLFYYIAARLYDVIANGMNFLPEQMKILSRFGSP